jgi:hypothetical protein
MLTIEQIQQEFQSALSASAPTNRFLMRSAGAFLEALREKKPVQKAERLYAECASRGVTFNYHQKCALEETSTAATGLLLPR